MSTPSPRRPNASLRRPSTYIDPDAVNPLSRGGPSPSSSHSHASSSRDRLGPGPRDVSGSSAGPTSSRYPRGLTPEPTIPPVPTGPPIPPIPPTTRHASSSSRGPSPFDKPPASRPHASSTASRADRDKLAKSKVGAALLSKRQSVAYNVAPHHRVPASSLPRVGGQPPVPGLPPSLPSGPGDARGVPARERRDENKIVPQGPVIQPTGSQGLDLVALSSDRFDPEKFMHASVGTSDPKALKAFREHLLAAQAGTNQDLQEGVYKNYSAFIAISKEIATLENEMLELKSVLEEFKTIPSSLESSVGAADDASFGGSITSDIRRRTARNSIADVNALYRVQLEALWSSVESSQKLLPYLPGRHLQAESSTFVELHPATYRPRQGVHLFLLNDALLVAVKKRTGMGSQKVKLVATMCFSLSEIAVIDLKDGGDLTNAIKIKRARETTIFRTDRPEDKKALLAAFKKVAEEMANKKRKQSIWEAEQRQQATSGRRGAAGILPPLPGSAGSTSDFSPSEFLGFGKSDSDVGQKDLTWIGDFSDELAVAIVLRTYEKAVGLVEKGKVVLEKLSKPPKTAGGGVGEVEGKESVAVGLFRPKLDQRQAELVSSLLHDLSSPSIRKSGVVATAAWLLRLGPTAADQARETFLDMRGKLVRRRGRGIKFEGDISLWVGELAMVVFTLVKNTCEWYVTAFRDNRMASGFVRWSSQQIEVYAEMFRRQVFGVDQDEKVVQESLAVTRAHAAMLKDVGLDFGFLLDALLRPTGQLKRRRSFGDKYVLASTGPAPTPGAEGEGGKLGRRKSLER